MKEEIKLEDLDFANNAKVRLTREPHWDFKEVNLQECELSFNGSSKEPYLRYKDVTFGLDQIKLYRRPLSDLTKEIEVNGEKFVPYDYFYDDPENDWFDGNVWLNYMFEGNSDKTDINYIPYYIIQKLYEWHFDIHNLIERGLAININTLEK